MVKRGILYLFFSLIPFLFSCSPGRGTIESETHPFKELSSVVSSGHVTMFAEDTLGYLWISTSHGLNKYNGSGYQHYFNSDDPRSLPHNMVNFVHCDSRGRLWVGTPNGICLYDYPSDSFIRVEVEGGSNNIIQLEEKDDGTLCINSIDYVCEFDEQSNIFRKTVPLTGGFTTKFFSDNQGKFWVVSEEKIYCYKGPEKLHEKSLPTSSKIHYWYYDRQHILWIAADNELFLLDTGSGAMLDVPAPLAGHPEFLNSTINLICHYEPGVLMVNTSNGTFLVYAESNTVVFQDESDFPFECPRGDFTAAYTDSGNNLIIGTRYHGFSIVYDYLKPFSRFNQLQKYFRGTSVTAVSSDTKDNIWIATESPLIWLYEQTTGKLRSFHLRDIAGVGTGKSVPVIKRIFIDGDDNIWLVGKRANLLKCSYNNGNLHLVKEFSFPKSIQAVAQDGLWQIWVGTESPQYYVLFQGNEEFESRHLGLTSFTFAGDFQCTPEGTMAAAYFNYGIFFFTPDGNVREFVDMSASVKGSIYPFVLSVNNNGRIVIGTRGYGLWSYDPQSGTLGDMRYPGNSDISFIQPDLNGNVWIGSMNGMQYYNTTTGNYVLLYEKDGIGGNQFNEKCSTVLSDNTLLFGGPHGLTVLNPDEMHPYKQKRILIEDIEIYGRLLRPGTPTMETNPVFSPVVKLSHEQNNIRIRFSSVDFRAHNLLKYKYRLDGYDAEWISAGNDYQTYYSKVPPGRYTFRVMTDNAEGSPVVEATLPIRIYQPLLKSTVARIVYFLIFAAIAVAVVIYMRRLNREKIAAAIAIREKEHEKYINRMNMNFFANISHELRTPLTMISGPVESLSRKFGDSKEDRHMLSILRRNINRMLRLVNQIMDINKLDNGMLRLAVNETDISAVTRAIVDEFSLGAREKEQVLTLSGSENPIPGYIDIDKFEKILSNLLSNAIKFSGEGGRISIRTDVLTAEETSLVFDHVKVFPACEYVKLSISDNGPGIPPDKLEDVFVRYYQLGDGRKGVYNWGTGIGLHYCRMLARLHKGDIRAFHREGQGALVSFVIPICGNVYNPGERTGFDSHVNNIPLYLDSMKHDTGLAIPEPATGYSVLLIDDDSEVTAYLGTLLSEYYLISIEHSAATALENLENRQPDLIICDVSMPGMDGYEFCRRIKGNVVYSHIPVVLLTAKVTVTEQVEGLDSGADAYVTKPFENSYLLALLRSLLKNRENARNILGKKVSLQKKDDKLLSPADYRFMQKLYKLMEEGITEKELNVIGISETLNISRTKAYYKIKGLTGVGPNEFFRKYKLNRAEQLLRETEHNISEIADITGFATVSYFSICFKKQFGLSPSDYRNRSKF